MIKKRSYPWVNEALLACVPEAARSSLLPGLAGTGRGNDTTNGNGTASR